MTAAFAGAPNPGDTSNEAVNAFNHREDVPVTEIVVIDRDDLPGPPQDGPDLVTNDDRIPRRVGPEDWKAPAYFREEPRVRDNQPYTIVARAAEQESE